MGALLGRHTGGQGFRLAFICMGVIRFGCDHERQDRISAETTSQPAKKAHAYARGLRWWFVASAAEPGAPHVCVPLFDGRQPRIHLRQFRAGLRFGERPIQRGTVDFAAETATVPFDVARACSLDSSQVGERSDRADRPQ